MDGFHKWYPNSWIMDDNGWFILVYTEFILENPSISG
jgi:hypothetical protein